MPEIVRAINHAATWIDNEQRLVALNDPMLRLTGAAMAGRHFVTAFRDPAVVDAIEQGFHAPTTAQWQHTAAARQKPVIFDLSARPLFGGVLIILTDRTAANEADQMRRDFIANVSHELRTPVTAISGFVETLQGAARDDATARERFLKIMEQEAKRMTRLVDDLMALSRLEGQERKRPTETVDLGQVVAQAVGAMEPVAKAASTDIVITAAQSPANVRGDAAQLQQVIANLLENALKYGRRGGVVSISIGPTQRQARLRAQGVVLEVSDDGDGIAEHHIARLTERFYRVDSHRSREVGGTGLGLAIVKHIISRHRGRLTIKSEKGKGATFRVILPT